MRAPTSFGLVHHGFRAALIGALSLVAIGHAHARDNTGAIIGGAAAGLLGGVALGAALNSPPPPRPRPVYVEEEAAPVYVAPRRRGPVCHYERRKVWLDEAEFTYKRVEVCE
ncbi:hypothetical protein [Methylobacterium brachythecii]|uniref:Uncharacterized protein n=1 Tax=Methylobacterium brachythecii TaxID=1176177 RepID=A0A7W6AFX6_9HYPH|nr:hypothetical protein [Methylobacterium brachythecii]MBB3900819.1 hypothetical protein [Methylobacterium brachythecii]GLS46040.1 hypothetical protein GCM10007884_40310 [Methylobacterium brachythecii]